MLADALGRAFADVLDSLRESFPPPDRAPTHAERQNMTRAVLAQAGNAIVAVALRYGLPDGDAQGTIQAL